MTVFDLLNVDPAAPLPLAGQLSQQLTWLIASGQIGEGERLPSVRKLAQQLGMSLHTVRAAYAQLESDNLVTTRQGSGTTVLPFDRWRLAASRPRSRTFTIGVLIPEFTPFYAPYLRGLEAAAREHDDPSLLFICNTHDYLDAPTFSRFLDQLVAKNVDGIILTSASRDDLQDIIFGGPSLELPPIVGADAPAVPGPAVLFDLEGGGFEVTRHLLDHGHRRIGLITPPPEWDQISPIIRGYERALTEAGLAVEPELSLSGADFLIETGAELATRLLDLPKPPTAIFAAGDMLALGAMTAVKAHGLRIPDDIALTGYGGVELTRIVDPPLTTFAMPTFELGVETMTMLLRLIAGEDVGQQRVSLKGSLVVRQSCGQHD
jgi:DNA-binding LacI/PurR family transcriptional regulator